MPPLETVKVVAYRTLSSFPNPAIDVVVGTDTTVFPGAVNWSFDTTGWSAGRWKIYAIGEDLAGNDTVKSDIIDGIVTSRPLNVCDSTTWSIGDLSAVLLGTTVDQGGAS